MNNANRRTFLKTAGAGAAAAGTAIALSPSATAIEGAPAAAPAATLPTEAKGSMVAYIHDVSTGEVSVMVEGHEVTVTDHQLVAKIAQAMHANHQV